MLEGVVNWIVGIVGQWGYVGIVVMMFLESSCFPFPSEVVMIPAGYLSSPAYLQSANYRPGHEMNIWIAIAMGIIGSWLGALFNYYLAMLLGRPLLLNGAGTSSSPRRILRRVSASSRCMARLAHSRGG